ncbi:hypothetical protein SBA4_1640003 [Candidatus Sulfopaludibacter sp. SbA4]|nr:hypothetical protein SBA4_1640003 [Candidatus Sulfopaludibacter sp. SbA4]
MASYRAVPPPGRRSRMARSSLSVSSIRSETSSGEVSKLTTMALSWDDLTTLLRNSLAASCSNLKRSRMLLLVSIRTASRRGRSLSALNSMIGWTRLFSITSKSALLRSVTKRPFLSVTVNSMFTRVTSTMMRLLSSACSTVGLGGWVGFCSAPQTARPSTTMAPNRTQTFICPDYNCSDYLFGRGGAEHAEEDAEKTKRKSKPEKTEDMESAERSGRLFANCAKAGHKKRWPAPPGSLTVQLPVGGQARSVPSGHMKVWVRLGAIVVLGLAVWGAEQKHYNCSNYLFDAEARSTHAEEDAEKPRESPNLRKRRTWRALRDLGACSPTAPRQATKACCPRGGPRRKGTGRPSPIFAKFLNSLTNLYSVA